MNDKNEDIIGTNEEQLLEEELQAEELTAEESIDKLKEAIDKGEEYLNMALRIQADFENYKRRNNNAREKAYSDGVKDLVKSLLPVCDNFERALLTDSSNEPLKEGLKLVHLQLMDILAKRGVSVIERKGEKFDPNLEDAVVQGASDEGAPGTVSEVFLKGYKIGETVIRHAMVKVVAEN